MLDREKENIETLRSALGMNENVAAEKLATRVAITVSETESGNEFKSDLAAVLGMTLQVVPNSESCDIEVVLDTPPCTDAKTVYHIRLNDNGLSISSTADQREVSGAVHGLVRKIAACYAAGFVINKVIGHAPYQEPFTVHFVHLGISDELLKKPVILSETALAGAGGVANGFMWALREINVSGSMAIVDNKKVGSGNLNRCQYMKESDIGRSKAEVLAKNAAIPSLEIVSFEGKLHEYIKRHGNVYRVISTVDSRKARRSIQSDFPIEIIDASTTDITAVVAHSNRQPTAQPCLACIYPHVAEEISREQQIADALGLDLSDVQKGIIDQKVADKIVRLMPEYKDEKLVGMAFDSLYKVQCARQNLKPTAAGKQAAAPLAFISHLAGALLVLELLRLEDDKNDDDRANYIVTDPWREPHPRSRSRKKKNVNCEFCSDKDVVDTYAELWPEHFTKVDESEQA